MTKPNFMLIFCALVFASCAPEFSEDSDINAKAVNEYLESENLLSGPHLKIKNAALGQDFMFYGTFIPMLTSPSGHSLKGRIVRFEKFADRMILLESPKGHSLADGSASTIMLAEFPIVKSDSEGNVIDFAKGMNNVFTTRNVQGSSAANPTPDSSGQFRAVSLSASFVKSISTDHNVLTLSQIAQWKNIKMELISAEFRYYFREYAPDAQFEKKTLGLSRHGQYFATPPQLIPPSSEPVEFITKWNLKKPVVFHISHNTPADYRQAVKDGLLFWNHIFGKEIIKVKDLAANISAPHPRLNIVQWVPWDNEASAYADMIVDHLTGETTQAQIYVRSGWVFGSARKLRSELQKLLLSEQTEKVGEQPHDDTPLPAMFEFDDPCYKTFNNPEGLSDLADFAASSSISDKNLKAITADIITTVVAHELGHVLGLRHNMASSTASNISLGDRAKALKEYLTTGHSSLGADSYLSRSIMDVFSAADDGLLGAQIREIMKSSDLTNSKLARVYLYDKQAIDYGYFNKPMVNNTPFCTDEDMKLFLDCRRWDITATPVLYAASKLNNLPTQVAMVLAETFMTAISPDRKGGPIAIRDVPLSTLNVLKSLQANTIDLFSWFNRGARSIQIEAKFPAPGPQNRELLNKARFDSVHEQVDKQGVSKTLFSLMPAFRPAHLQPEHLLKVFNSQFDNLLQTASQKHPELRLSPEQRLEVNDIALNFFKALNTDITTIFTGTLGRLRFDDPSFQLPIEAAIGTIARDIIFSPAESGAKSQGALPVFKYDTATREAAALLLSPSMSVLPDWSLETMRTVSDDLKRLMRMHSGSNNAGAIDLFSLPRETRQWLLEQNKILSALGKAKSMQRSNDETSRDK